MKTALSPSVQRLLEEKVSSGQYGSADEVVKRGLALIEREEARQSHTASSGADLAETFSSLAAEVPDSEWQKVPPDLARDPDAYLYGVRKAS
ncbi:MAG: type II toxin-antitoxin system ParD family antitoxin [Acidobacteriaceae bacterium]|jgi:putative addiction module CopG family antidote